MERTGVTAHRRAALLSILLATAPVMAALATGAAAISGATGSGQPQLAETELQGITDCTDALQKLHNPDNIVAIGENSKLVCFTKYLSDFDTRQVQVAVDKTAAMGVPRWVIHRVEPVARDKEVAEAFSRPSSWYTIPSLARESVAPEDKSYRFSKKFRDTHGDWYERGHLAQKYLSERPPEDDLVGRNSKLPDDAGAGWFTHNLANAVPQRARFNKGPWLTLECYTGAWANRYQGVWVVSGPIFLNGRPIKWMKSDRYKDAIPVAVPDALFKVVVRKRDGQMDALAFIYPQESRDYREKKVWNPAGYLTSLSQIRRLTGVDILQQQQAAQPADDPIPLTTWQVERRDFDPSCRRFAPEPS